MLPSCRIDAETVRMYAETARVDAETVRTFVLETAARRSNSF